MQDDQYPIGKFRMLKEVTPAQRMEWIREMETAPKELRLTVNHLTDEQLDTPYREGGWMIRQVVHHLPDRHLNSYIRFKLVLTEERPIIKPYAEQKWAELTDVQTVSVETSLRLLESLHERWTALFYSLTPSKLNRTYIHPESGVISLEQAIALYAWHGKHHIAQIRSLVQRMGWENQ